MSTEKKFIDAANNSLIDSWMDEEIDIRSPDLVEVELSLPFQGNFKENFYNKPLVVSNCPNLKKLDLRGLNLTGLKIENCPNLETLDFSHNQIKEFNLTGLNKLENLYCSGNELTSLDLTVLKECEKEYLNEETGEKYTKTAIHLRNLLCNNNPITKLEVKHLSELESLYCFKCHLSDLDFSNLDKIREIYCANNKIKVDGRRAVPFKLNFANCKSLEIVDCAENLLASPFSMVKLDKLNFVSMRNSCNEIIYVDNPSIPIIDEEDSEDEREEKEKKISRNEKKRKESRERLLNYLAENCSEIYKLKEWDSIVSVVDNYYQEKEKVEKSDSPTKREELKKIEANKGKIADEVNARITAEISAFPKFTAQIEWKGIHFPNIFNYSNKQ